MAPSSTTWQTWRRRWEQNPMYGDALLMLLLSPITLLSTLSMAASSSTQTSVGMVVLGLAMTLPLLARRTRPELAALVVVAAHVAQLVLVATPVGGNIVAPMMLYAVVRYGSRRHDKAWLAVSVTGALLGAARWGWIDSYGMSHPQRLARCVAFFIVNVSMMLAAWFMGQWARQRQMTLDSLRQRTEALEREHAKAVALAGEEERNRIAREMHDIVAHSLSVIVVQADGAGYLAEHSELGDAEARLAQVTRAISTIRETAGTALGETRRLVGVLRQEGDAVDLTPAATLDQIADLVHNLGSSGIPARFERTGDPQAHLDFSSGAQMALYRVAQESLTNVMKHAGPGASVVVRLHEDARGAWLQVADTGRGATPTDGAGHGVIGMQERMTAFGGTLSAGAREGGGFEVLAQLPAVAEPPTVVP